MLTIVEPATTGGGGAGSDSSVAATDGASTVPPDPTAGAPSPPAVSEEVAWKNLFNLGSLPEYFVAKALMVKYNDADWEQVMAPFDLEYHDNHNSVMKMIGLAPAAKYVLTVNNAGSVHC